MNPRVLEISASLIREIASRKRATSIDLGLGEPSLRPRAEHLEHALRHVIEHGLKCTPNAGDPALRDAIARHYGYPGLEHGRNVCVTVGSQEAMYVTLKTLLDPARDELLIVEPAFPSYAKMAALEGVAVRSVAMSRDDDFAFDAERIAAAIGERTRAIVLCSPCNPTARVVDAASAESLVRALERRTEPVWIVHDEIYREQTFLSNPGYFAQIYPHTIVTNSLSKSNALTGLRLGWTLGPADFVAQATKVHAWATSCADTFAQQVALHVFHTPDALHEHAAWYRDRRGELLSTLRDSGLRFISPEGTFYVCVELPGGTPSHRAAEELIERHDVVAIPGIAFGLSMEGWLRLSWVAAADRVRDGILRIADYCASLPVST
jgi:aspartate/methionine/tyrosine aminotransferase